MLTETFNPFFTDFGQTATVGGVEALVIFDAAYEAANVGQMVMASTQPAFTIATAKVPANAVGSTVVIGSKTFTIAAHEPDGTGISVCWLEAVL